MAAPGGLSAAARAALLARMSLRKVLPGAAAPSSRRGFEDLPGAEEHAMLETALDTFKLRSPFYRPHDGLAAGHSRMGNRDMLNFSSYNYLGLNGDPRVTAAAKAAIDRYGVSVSASRVVSGERPIHAELEAALAALHGAEDAVTFVSGHATNVTVIGHLLGPRDLIVHDAAIHNSCLEGARLSGARRLAFAHNDWQAAERELAAARAGANRALILVEGHYSMDGDTPDLARFVALARRHDAWLMVDEAHSVGVLGATGRGIAEAQGVDPAEIDIWMGTLSKTLSGCGGYIAGNRLLVQWLKRAAPGFVYSVGLAPALAAAALESLAIMRAEPARVARLNANAALFARLARQAGFDTGTSEGHAIVPIILGSSLRAAQLSDALYDLGVNVQPIIFPAVPEKTARLRFFISADHAPADIEAAVAALAEAQRALG